MKFLRYFLFLSLIGFAFTFTSCKKEKRDVMKSEYIRPASMDYTSKDSADIYNLLNQFMGCMKGTDFTGAANMLYTLKGDSLKPLTAKQRDGMIDCYSHMHIYDMKVKAFELQSATENHVTFSIQIVKHGDISKDIGVTKLSVNPVKIKDSWFLTLYDNRSLRVEEFK